MSLLVKFNKYQALPPEGLHVARCFAVIDCGRPLQQPTYLPQVLFAWELSDALQDDGMPFIQLQRYAASLSERSKLRNMLEDWRGKQFNDSELTNGFQLENMLDATCLLTTRQITYLQKRWSELSYITPLPSYEKCPAPIYKPILGNLENLDEATYLELPEIIRRKINSTT